MCKHCEVFCYTSENVSYNSWKTYRNQITYLLKLLKRKWGEDPLTTRIGTEQLEMYMEKSIKSAKQGLLQSMCHVLFKYRK